MSSTLYGRFPFPGIEALIARLGQISAALFGHAAFNTYLSTHEGNIRYGLNEEELRVAYDQPGNSLRTLAATCSTPDGKVIRISVRFDPQFMRGRGHYLIAMGGDAENRMARGMILGEWIPHARTPAPMYVQASDPRVALYRPERDALPDIEEWQTGYEAFSHARPAFHLADTFYFDRHISIEQLLDFIEQLSVRYLGGAPFHAQLKTTDGDYYFNIDSQELRYMFRKRRHVLFTLFLDATASDGQWVDLLFSFHPLRPGPNAELVLNSCHPDGILALVRESIAVGADTTHVPEMQWLFSLDASSFSLENMLILAQEASMDYLLRIPPVVFLATREGKDYTGLSLYQLERIYSRHANRIEVLSLDITRALTGQMMRLVFQPDEQGTIRGRLSINWGEAEVHTQIRRLIEKRLLIS